MARKKGRRKASNSWFGESRRHARAAKKGWRGRRGGRGRRRSRNAGIGATLGSIPGAATSAFKTEKLKQAGFIIAGNLATTWTAEKLMNAISALKTNTVTRVGTVLVTSGIVAAASKMVTSHSGDVLTGGMLSGLTRALREAFPSTFGSLSDDLDDYVDPRQIMTARNGINDYVDPRQIMTARNGINDYADFRQVQAPVRLDGLQEEMVAEEISNSAY